MCSELRQGWLDFALLNFGHPVVVMPDARLMAVGESPTYGRDGPQPLLCRASTPISIFCFGHIADPRMPTASGSSSQSHELTSLQV